MKHCPFCAEEIQDAAVKCKHCGEFLDSRGRAADRGQWYFKPSVIVIAVLTVGPLALPLIWWRPKTSRGWKIGLTLAILALSWVSYRLTVESLRSLQESYRMLESL